jgi:hypothetical protein
MSPKDEESPADYNYGGYLQVKVADSFKDGRYSVVRKLGSVPPFHNTQFCLTTLALDGVIFPPSGSLKTHCECHLLNVVRRPRAHLS